VVEVVARNKTKEIMALLLNQRGDEVKITIEVVEAVARNKTKEIMALLLDQRGDEVQITEEVVKAVARNSSNGKEVIALFLD
jgi:CMP-2-keto-3-deoxyoctulosonic acid synthetase